MRRKFREKFTPRGSVLAIVASALENEYPTGATEEPEPDESSGIAVVAIAGPLEHHQSVDVFGNPCWDSYDSIIQRLEAAFSHDDVRAVVMRIDSPGGDAAGATEANRTIMRLKAEYGKPLYAYSDESMYSAAYELGCAADEIWVPSTGGVGSVGCIGVAVDRTKQNEKIGVRVKLLTTGAHKADTYPDRELTAEVEAALQDRVDFLGNSFFEVVAECRQMSIEEVEELGAATFLGEDAVKSGLADHVGGWYEFINHVAEQLDTTSAAQEIPSMKTRDQLQKEYSAMVKKITASKSSVERGKLASKLGSIAVELAAAKHAPKAAAAPTKAKAKAKAPAAEEAEEEDMEESEEEESEEEPDEDDTEESEASEEGDDDEEDDEEEEAASVQSMGFSAMDRMISAVSKITGKKGASAMLGTLEAMADSPKSAVAGVLGTRVARLEGDRLKERVASMITKARKEGRIDATDAKALMDPGMKNPKWLKAYLGQKTKAVRNIEDGPIASKLQALGKPVDVTEYNAEQLRIVEEAATAAGVTVEEFAKRMSKHAPPRPSKF